MHCTLVGWGCNVAMSHKTIAHHLSDYVRVWTVRTKEGALIAAVHTCMANFPPPYLLRWSLNARDGKMALGFHELSRVLKSQSQTQVGGGGSSKKCVTFARSQESWLLANR